ncbi:TetR family transcriptional regulator [Gryllotalpicola protaetiae]|uniref:TetR/AcrR family transcriptional regulator n=1 Tax=Gryllotalpicola protaetiae TaxID=2419771 RepID=A0A387BW25_9MICO|nr:TetR family transcriptional regulator [Gryllotalpicola protaetiae]AYG02581.1 TetR/AcrR family transcriptional regulator [Gryllotalpicola protaetiae]
MEQPLSTRDRILAAAIAEFADRGFAGARIDRIAAAAKANKERIYAYFGDKESLFRAAMSSAVTDASVWLPDSGDELVRATGDLFDTAFDNPELGRLLTWRRLENTARGDEDEQSQVQQKVADIRDAQAKGIIDSSWNASDLLAIVAALSGAWASAPAALKRLAEAEGQPVSARRAIVEEAMRRILRPQPQRE